MTWQFFSKVRWRWPRVRPETGELRAEVRAMVTIVFMGIAVTGALFGMRQLGGLEPLELVTYDLMVQAKQAVQPLPPDDRILVVGITEDDINHYVKRYPVPDEVLAEAIAKLQQFQPTVIGVDLWRNLPNGSAAGYQRLLQQFQAANVYVITKLGETPPPAMFAKPDRPGQPDHRARVGANDVPIDPDGVLRRNFLFPTVPNPRDPIFSQFSEAEDGVFYSLALRLALAALAQQGIFANQNPSNPNYLQLGKATFVPLRSHSGGYQTIDAARHDQDTVGYQMLVNWRSGHPAFPQISLRQLLENQFQPQQVQGKVVLIGVTAPSAKDLFLTPYSLFNRSADARMPGVIFHAHSVSQILDVVSGQRPLLGFWSDATEALWILSWILLGGSLGWWMRHPLGLGMGALTLLGALGGITFGWFIQGVWIPLAAPALGSLAMGTSLVAYRAYQAQQRQQMVMTLLGQNASPAIAAALWKNRDHLLKSGKLPGQRLIATMLFTDVMGFSSISEQISAEALMEWLNDYLGMLSQVVQVHNGIINKFTGDGIMAVFGVPVPHTTPEAIGEDAINAVQCALEMHDRLTQLNQIWESQGRSALKMRVGIFTGPVVVGSLGSKDRLEYGVIGDSVNIASRLESCQKERQVSICRILIAAETLSYLHDRFQVESWGPLELKGKQQTVEVYRVIDARQT